jgi:hypothetical protein
MKHRVLIILLLALSIYLSKAQDDLTSFIDMDDGFHENTEKRMISDNSIEINGHNIKLNHINKSLITFIIKSKKKSPYKWTTRRDDEVANGISKLFRHGIVISPDQRRPINQFDIINVDSFRRYKKKKPFKWG